MFTEVYSLLLNTVVNPHIIFCCCLSYDLVCFTPQIWGPTACFKYFVVGKCIYSWPQYNLKCNTRTTLKTQDREDSVWCYSDKRFPGVSGLWVSAGSRWLDSWNATQPRNVLVITCCSRFTSLTRNMTGLIVGFAEEGLCDPLQGPNGIQQLTCKVQVGCLQPQHFLPSNTVRDAAFCFVSLPCFAKWTDLTDNHRLFLSFNCHHFYSQLMLDIWV